MSNINNNREWSDAIKDSLKGAEMQASDALWNNIEKSLEVGVVTRPKGRINLVKVVSGVAALLIIALLFFVKQDSDVKESVSYEQFVENKDNEKIEAESYVVDTTNSEKIAEILPEIKSFKSFEPKEDLDEIIIDSVEEQIENAEKEEKIIAKKEEEKPKNESFTKKNNKYNLYDRVQPRYKTRNTKLSLLYAGGLGSRISNMNNNPQNSMIGKVMATYAGPIEMSFEDKYNSFDISHHQPLGLGLRVEQELSDKFSIGSGLNYTFLMSDIDTKSSDKLKQQIHFLGLPVNFNYKYDLGRNFELYAGVGGSVEYCLGAKVGNKSINEHLWHYSADLNVGAVYNINDWFGVYFEPSVSHYFTKTYLKSVRNNSPTTFNLRLGVSFTFSSVRGNRD